MFVLGTIIGSFFNGLSHRVCAEKKLFSSRSKCSACNSAIPWYDLIPVLSWVLLKGKCRSCNNSIPFRYPVVEIMTGALTVLFFRSGQIDVLIILQYAFVLSFFFNALTDFINFYVYNPFIYLMVGISLGLAFFKGDMLLSVLSGFFLVMIIGTVSYLVGLWLKKKAMGAGDFFVFFSLGMLLIPEEMVSLVLFASLSGIALAGIFRREKVPFYPLLFSGYIFVLLGGSLG